MLQPYLHQLSAEKIILASSSPRRKQILEMVNLDIHVIPSGFEENLDKSLFAHPRDYVMRSAVLKALDTSRKLIENNELLDKKLPFVIIGADTVVVMDDRIIEKPDDKEHAVRMLTSLSGRIHEVYTGVALLVPKPEFLDQSLPDDRRFEMDVFHIMTEVEFDELDPETVQAYVESGEPMDKAGGYGIQALGGTLVKGIRGDYFNVMGFPLNCFARHLVSICKRKFL